MGPVRDRSTPRPPRRTRTGSAMAGRRGRPRSRTSAALLDVTTTARPPVRRPPPPSRRPVAPPRRPTPPRARRPVRVGSPAHRCIALLVALAVAFALVIVRLVDLQVVAPGHYASAGLAQRLRTVPPTAQ